MAKDDPFFISQNMGFSKCAPEDDLLHPVANARVAADSLTETQYFGYSVPEQEIHGVAYLWHHPNLKVVTAGTYAFQGVKRFTVAAELANIRAFMSDAPLKNDLHEYRLDNGYGVKVVEPLKRFHVTYADAARGNSLDLHYTAVCPPVMFGDGNHFEQSMKVEGEVTLRGRRYAVNCFNVRDRSWGKPRPEDVMPLPPMSWMTGVFNESFSFNCNMFDKVVGTDPAALRFQMPEEKLLNGGWVYRDGTLGRIVRGTKTIVREPGSLLPLNVTLDVVDEHARAFSFSGTLVAACPWQAWPNLIFQVCLVRWECDGLVTHGDCQEGFWNDYLLHVSELRRLRA